MTEEKKRSWDVWLGIAAPLITVTGLLIGVWQFNAGERNKTELEYKLLKEKDRIDFERKLWLDRVSTYRSIADLAGAIAAHDGKDANSQKELAGLVLKFRSAYWGLMILAEDQAVKQEMVAFWAEIHDVGSNWSNDARLKQRAAELVEACRASIEKGSAL
jgi:hypothetical protein